MALKGRTEARIATPPLRPLTEETTLGYDCIRFAENVLRLQLLEWQKWFLIHALELLPDGSFRFRTVLLLVARQNGKSTLAQVLGLYRMFIDGCPLVLGTAQNLDIAEELWESALALADGIPRLEAEIAKRSYTNGKKFFALSSGERWAVTSATRKGARGRTKVGLAILDELREHTDFDAWSAISGTTIAESSAMILGASNAGDVRSVVLRKLRRQAMAAIERPSSDDGSDTIGIFEWSAPDGCDIWDRDAWTYANPGLGFTIHERALAAAAAVASDEEEWIFRVEHLCQWVEMRSTGPFPEGRWAECADAPDPARGHAGAEIAADSPLVLGIDTSWSRSASAFVIAGWDDDGEPVIEDIARVTSSEDVIATAVDLCEDWPIRAVVVQERGAPASHLISHLTDAGLPVVPLGGANLSASGAELYDRIKDGTIRHRDQAGLTLAAENAAIRAAGEAWLLDRQHSPVEIMPLCAATQALWGLQHLDPEEDEGSAYDQYEFATM